MTHYTRALIYNVIALSDSCSQAVKLGVIYRTVCSHHFNHFFSKIYHEIYWMKKYFEHSLGFSSDLYNLRQVLSHRSSFYIYNCIPLAVTLPDAARIDPTRVDPAPCILADCTVVRYTIRLCIVAEYEITITCIELCFCERQLARCFIAFDSKQLL